MATDMDQHDLAQQLLAQAKEQGIELVRPNRLLNLTQNLHETALGAETNDNIGYEMHDTAGRGVEIPATAHTRRGY